MLLGTIGQKVGETYQELGASCYKLSKLEVQTATSYLPEMPFRLMALRWRLLMYRYKYLVSVDELQAKAEC